MQMQQWCRAVSEVSWNWVNKGIATCCDQEIVSHGFLYP